MTLARHIRGYDPATDRLGASYPLSAETFAAVRRLVAAHPDDPDMIDPYELSPAVVATLGLTPVSDSLLYYLEAEADPATVATARHAMLPAA